MFRNFQYEVFFSVIGEVTGMGEVSGNIPGNDISYQLMAIASSLYAALASERLYESVLLLESSESCILFL